MILNIISYNGPIVNSFDTIAENIRFNTNVNSPGIYRFLSGKSSLIILISDSFNSYLSTLTL